MSGKDGILIVGGYGHVGLDIAARLSRPQFPPVRLAGRNAAKAREAAASLGCGGVHIDLQDQTTWDHALEGINVVVVCIDQDDARFPAHVLARGMAYVDITASDRFFREVEALDELAREKGGSAILSAGLAPGLTNLLVKACADGLEHPMRARIGIMLGLGDAHGPAAIAWTLEQFRSFRGRAMPVETMPFGAPPRNHPAIPFDFADQHVVRRTLGLADTRTLLTFDSPLLALLTFPLLRFIAASPWRSRFAAKAMLRFRFGSDRAALAVEVQGRDGSQRAQLEGRKEARITALVTALAVEHILRTGAPAGVRHIEQVLSIETLAPALREHGVVLRLPDRPAPGNGAG